MNTMSNAHWTTQAVIVAPAPRRDVVEQELDAEVLLFDPQNGSTYRLNQTALAVWRACDGRASTHQIAKQLTETYDVDMETAFDHVEQLVMMFTDSQLLDLPGHHP